MKKYILGIGVAVIFLAYSHILRNQHSEPVVAPVSLSHNNSTPTTTKSTTTSTPTTTTTVAPTTTVSSLYKDGTYTGSVENAYYGNVQVQATVQNGKIITVDFLEYPNENPNSIYVNQQAIPYLKQEAVNAQSSNVSIVTGATFTSQAFRQSLSNALNQAKQS
jgi:uncharacterized protein with FMN-binding domain